MLSALKGIGKKMAEKLLVELQSLAEKGILRSSAEAGSSLAIDADALEALRSLGYDERTVLACLRDVPKDVKTTEGRVKHVLQSL
jgi:Holliday junction resolvasome RuvABC DNA-binding subunit